MTMSKDVENNVDEYEAIDMFNDVDDDVNGDVW